MAFFPRLRTTTEFSLPYPFSGTSNLTREELEGNVIMITTMYVADQPIIDRTEMEGIDYYYEYHYKRAINDAYLALIASQKKVLAALRGDKELTAETSREFEAALHQLEQAMSEIKLFANRLLKLYKNEWFQMSAREAGPRGYADSIFNDHIPPMQKLLTEGKALFVLVNTFGAVNIVEGSLSSPNIGGAAGMA